MDDQTGSLGIERKMVNVVVIPTATTAIRPLHHISQTKVFFTQQNNRLSQGPRRNEWQRQVANSLAMISDT